MIKLKNPVTEAAIPPKINQRVSSVGDPVKIRETSEVNDSDAFIPKNKRVIPNANNAKERAKNRRSFTDTIVYCRG